MGEGESATRYFRQAAQAVPDAAMAKEAVRGRGPFPWILEASSIFRCEMTEEWQNLSGRETASRFQGIQPQGATKNDRLVVVKMRCVTIAAFGTSATCGEKSHLSGKCFVFLSSLAWLGSVLVSTMLT